MALFEEALAGMSADDRKTVEWEIASIIDPMMTEPMAFDAPLSWRDDKLRRQIVALKRAEDVLRYLAEREEA